MWSEDIKEAVRAALKALQIMISVVLLALTVVTVFFLTSPHAYGQWDSSITDMRKAEVRDGMWVTLVCQNWEEGFYDGYCALQEVGCVAPNVAPFCPWQSFRTTRQAYQRGYHRGETDYILDWDIKAYNQGLRN